MSEKLLFTPREVARLFRVDSKTVNRWALAGRFPAGAVIRTPGGHYRYVAERIRELADGGTS